MTKFKKVDLDITEHKPKMKPIYVSSVKDLRAIPFVAGMTAQVKADGEFNFVHLDWDEAYCINRFGRKTTDLPALKEAHTLFRRHIVETFRDKKHQMEVLAELYGVDENGNPVTLPNLIHMLKGGDVKLQERIHLGIFDIISTDDDMNDKIMRRAFNHSWRMKLMDAIFKGNLVHVLQYIVPKNQEIIGTYYEDKIKEGWEGLVIRVNGDTYKAKPNCNVDAVIIGINKNTKGYEKGLAKSVVVALLNDEGNFVVLGDATVPSIEEARALFELTRVKVGEDPTTVWVKPLVVVEIAYISLFPDTTNDVRKGDNVARQVGITKFVRMKSPRVVGYRKDKKVCTQDIGVNQVGE